MMNVEEVPPPDYLRPTTNSVQHTRQMDTHPTSSTPMMESHGMD